MNNSGKSTESLQDSLHDSLKATNTSIVNTVLLIFAGFVGGGATGFFLLKHGKIAFDYLSLLTVVNFCLGIYNIFALHRLKKQRFIIKIRLSYLEIRDNDSGGLLGNHYS